MPTLHVRNVPDRIYRRIRRLAQAESRSLSAEVVTLLDRAVQIDASRAAQARILAGIERRRLRRRLLPGAPDSLELLREDRAR